MLRSEDRGCYFMSLRVRFPPWSSSFAAFSLLNVQDSVAAGTGVVRVLEPLHEQWNQAAAKD